MTGRKVEEKMADIRITYSCGCGFKTDKLINAAEHSDSKKHSMTVLGVISKSDTRARIETHELPKD